MDIEEAERVDRRIRSTLTELIDNELLASGISKSALAVATNIPRETLRRNIANGDLTVPQMFKIALHLGGDFFKWMIALEARLKDES